jgi:hypothetical protein
MCRPLFSDFHSWFVEMGYPELDIVEYEDGSWDIIQFIGQTVIPAETKWQVVLGGIKNQLKTYSFCEYWAKRLDMHKKFFWDLEDFNQKKHLMDAEEQDRHVEDLAERMTHVITHTPTMMERIVKNGAGEMLLHKLACHVPKNELKSLHKPQ